MSRVTPSPWRRTALAAAVLATFSAGSGAMFAEAKAPNPAVQAPSVRVPQQSFADLVEAVQPAVVSILVEARAERAGVPQFRMPDDPRFREFFQRFLPQAPAERPVRGAGSGFIVDTEGYVVTNHHVVDGAREITVVLDDGSRHEAVLQGSDPKTDLALLKIDAGRQLPWVELGDSDHVRVGDWVVAIGNPFGLGGTVTTGIVSARGRNINAGPYDDFLQIDAPINRGNSGGPLFDLHGKVVGVNTAIFSPNGGNVGIGFAIPSAQVRTVVAALKESGRVERGWLGVQIQPLTDELAEALALPDDKGALVAAITPDSPADRAGIRSGDVIVAFDGTAVESVRDLPRLVARAAPGSEARLELLRDGERRQLHVTLTAMEPAVARTDAPAANARLGVAVAPVDDAARSRFRIPEGVTGALVMQVEPDGAAAAAGLRTGDVILQADGKPVAAPGDLVAVLHEGAEDGKLVLLVNRQGNQWFVPVQVARG